MKFLLVGINSKYIHSNPAIHYLKEYVGEEMGRYVELAEYTINNRREEILADLYRRRPDAIGISCYIWNFTMVQELLAEIPKILPACQIWLGGPEVSYEGAQVLRDFPMVKGIMVGEGEETFRELLSVYVEKGSEAEYRKIPGLLLPEGSTAPRSELDMDQLPFLYEDLTEYENRILYYESSRGCPFGCTYCLSSVDRRVRLRSLCKVKEELQFFLDHRVPQVKFVDRTFNCNRAHALTIWRYLKEHDNGVTNFHFEVAADIMDEEQLTLLSAMRPGFLQLEIGLQTTNERTLREINRYADTAHITKVVERLKKGENIHLHLDLIAGLPYEDYDSFAESFNQVYAMEPEQLQLGFLKVLKGSPLFYLTEKYGIVYSSLPPYEVLYTTWLPYEKLLKLKRIEEMVELYYNSNQFRATLRVLKNCFESPFRMFEALAEYYEEQGYFVNVPARSYRYQVLLAFASQVDSAGRERYRELLTFDYYLRENAKSRPEFAPDPAPWQKEIRAFYEKEEKQPTLLKKYQGYHAKQLMKMTHVEVFHYPVWERQVCDCENRQEKPMLLLFDYQQRNPLTMDAQISTVVF